MIRKCSVCGRELGQSEADVTLTLTEQERTYCRMTSGEEPPETLVYCKPCYRILSDRETGAELLKGALETQLRAEGVLRADEAAARYREFLLTHAAKDRVS